MNFENEKNNKCIYCGKQIKIQNIINLMHENYYCENCYSKFEIADKYLNVWDIDVFQKFVNLEEQEKFEKILNKDTQLYAFYKYNEYAKNFMHEYKRKENILISKVFSFQINSFFGELLKEYSKISIIVVSSSYQGYKNRKMNLNKEFLKNTINYSNITIFEAFFRKDNQTQGIKNLEERKISIHEYEKLNIYFPGELLVIFDDVVTSGKTLKNFISNIKKFNSQQKTILVTLFISKNLLKYRVK